MVITAERPTKVTAARKPDGVMTTQVKGHTIILELFFNHDSKETFQDKLLRAVFADKTA
jgi:hypothetical protein